MRKQNKTAYMRATLRSLLEAMWGLGEKTARAAE
uniref:Uncharacterized protein n=1 Tax=Arundo donax TaxID=35708 RepID=A0A0A9F3T6_ARUDO